MNKTYQILHTDPIHGGFCKLVKHQLTHSLFSGGESEPIVRELLIRGEAVAVLPYDPTINKVLLVEQFRVGAMQEDNAWLIELIAGIIEEGEKPSEVVSRESMEEAGIEIINPTKICTYLSSPGSTTEKMYVYFAKADLSQAGGLYGLADEGEDIKVHLYTPETLFAMMDRDEVNNAMTLIALQWFRRAYELKQLPLD